MPKPFKPTRPYPLPPGAEVVQHEGRPHVRMKERGKAVLYRVTKDGKGYLRPSKRWYFEVRDASGKLKRVKGFADLKATEQLAAEMERKAVRAQAGYFDPAEEHVRRPLAEHLKDYGAALEAKGDTTDHIRLTVGRIAAVISGCGFVFATDMNAGKAAGWLADLRRPGRMVDIPPGDFFPSSSAAKFLGISADAVRRFVARHRLPTVGNGSARRLPRATVEAIANRSAQGRGPTTINHYIRALRGFSRWLVRTKRIGADTLDSLSLVNEAVDVRHARRELAAEELQRLFVAARDSHLSFRGLTGADRFHLYLAAVGTGFRARAMANLTPGDFDLDSTSPCVTLPARFAKNRRTKVQPIPADVAEALRAFIAVKPAKLPIWGGTWLPTAAAMLRRDLEAAGIAYAVEGPDGPEHADFHSLRHSYLTLGGRSGIDLRTLQELAGHSTPTLTARYSRRRLHDLTGAVGKLPDLVPTDRPDVTRAELPLRVTGTDVLAVSGAVPGAVTGGAGPHFAASIGTLKLFGSEGDDSPQVPETTRPGALSHRAASVCISEGAGIRTQDLRIKSPLLYQLSYAFQVLGAMVPEIDQISPALNHGVFRPCRAFAPKRTSSHLTEKPAHRKPDGIKKGSRRGRSAPS
jgi:integrase